MKVSQSLLHFIGRCSCLERWSNDWYFCHCSDGHQRDACPGAVSLSLTARPTIHWNTFSGPANLWGGRSEAKDRLQRLGRAQAQRHQGQHQLAGSQILLPNQVEKKLQMWKWILTPQTQCVNSSISWPEHPARRKGIFNFFNSHWTVATALLFRHINMFQQQNLRVQYFEINVWVER